MHIRSLKRKTASGEDRRYVQLVESYRRSDGQPATRVLAHLGILDDIMVENLKTALACARQGQRVHPEASAAAVHVRVEESQLWLPLEVVCSVARRFGLERIVDSLCPMTSNHVSTYAVIEALIAQRCLEPDSKLAFQRWLPQTAFAEVTGIDPQRLNNSRVHRALQELADIDEQLQEAVADSRVKARAPRLLFLDLTDTWFEAGGGTLARRGQTKEGHRNKLKIHIALLVDDDGFPLRWRLLPGALSETTVLPSWVEALHDWPAVDSAVLVFDRGMPSLENFRMLTEEKRGRLFLSSIKSDSIATYVALDQEALDGLQALPADATDADIQAACAALNLARLNERTYARDLGVVEPAVPRNGRRALAPAMRMYVYFNPQMQKTRREGRDARMREVEEFVSTLNAELRSARQPRKRAATERKVMRLLEKKSLCELYEVHLEEYPTEGRTKPIMSWQVKLSVREDMLGNARRYDGVTLLVGHPSLSLSIGEAVDAYRQKATIEADFRTIKSVLNLRPTFHREDHKIQAHVTLCVLALLIERSIEAQLRDSSLKECPVTADALLAELASVSLTRLTVGERTHSVRVAKLGRARQLLAVLELGHLLDKFPCGFQQRLELEV